MSGILVMILMLVGTFFMVVAAIGVLRMPDLFMRLSAATKATTLGASSLLLATGVHFGDYGIAGRIGAIIAFIVMTTPVAAHMLGRAAYISNVPLWKETICDELRGRYDIDGHVLNNPDKAQEAKRH